MVCVNSNIVDEYPATPNKKETRARRVFALGLKFHTVGDADHRLVVGVKERL
jgi:hypothetical protein